MGDESTTERVVITPEAREALKELDAAKEHVDESIRRGRDFGWAHTRERVARERAEAELAKCVTR